MTSPKDREQELRRKELEIQAREQEIRLKELETQIYQEQRQARDINSSEPPLYETKKHKPPESSLQKFTKKLVKFGKFTAFVVVGIALIRVGLFIGIWMTYLLMAGIIAFIGYQIFLGDEE
ncbi:MAG: hypothetical protein Tsb0014_33130 [Pleurocapsa sp.]